MNHGRLREFEYGHFTLSNNTQSQSEITFFLGIATLFYRKIKLFPKISYKSGCSFDDIQLHFANGIVNKSLLIKFVQPNRKPALLPSAQENFMTTIKKEQPTKPKNQQTLYVASPLRGYSFIYDVCDVNLSQETNFETIIIFVFVDCHWSYVMLSASNVLIFHASGVTTHGTNNIFPQHSSVSATRKRKASSSGCFFLAETYEHFAASDNSKWRNIWSLVASVLHVSYSSVGTSFP